MRIGLIINPIAGMGGKVGLHGTDGDLYLRAQALGALPVSGDRALETLNSIVDLSEKIVFVTHEGEMGSEFVSSLGFVTEVLIDSSQVVSSSADTKLVAEKMLESGVELILFSGGDGTARDIFEVVGERIPMLGIPAGVKMRSGVFSLSPLAAGELMRRFVATPEMTPIHRVEILDVVLEGVENTWLPDEFFGVARAPFSQAHLQMAKSVSSVRGDAGIDALAQELASSLETASLYLIGPGTTTHRILDAMGLVGDVRGVDAVFRNQIIGRDLSENEILELLKEHPNATLFLGVIGGQGFLLGRGNQQLSSKVIEAVKPTNIVLISSADKIGRLFPAHLHVDLGDGRVESLLAGYHQVLVAPGRSIMCQIVIPDRCQQESIAV